MNINDLIVAIEKIEKEEMFESLLCSIAIKGRSFRPWNFVWDLLPVSLKVKEIILPENPKPEDLSPILVASFLKHGQILPIWVDETGRILEGRARAVFFASSTKYLIHPAFLTEQEIFEIRSLEKISNDALEKLAERLGVNLWRQNAKIG